MKVITKNNNSKQICSVLTISSCHEDYIEARQTHKFFLPPILRTHVCETRNRLISINTFFYTLAEKNKSCRLWWKWYHGRCFSIWPPKTSPAGLSGRTEVLVNLCRSPSARWRSHAGPPSLASSCLRLWNCCPAFTTNLYWIVWRRNSPNGRFVSAPND